MTESSDIGAILHTEHLHTLETLNSLEARILGGEEQPFDHKSSDDARFLKDLVATIDNDIYRHFRFEEDVLFPRLTVAGLQDVTAMLIEEHGMIREMTADLRALAKEALAQPLTADQWSNFRAVAMDFIHAAMFHIQKEEMGVIRNLPMMIEAPVRHELATRYENLERPRPGG